MNRYTKMSCLTILAITAQCHIARCMDFPTTKLTVFAYRMDPYRTVRQLIAKIFVSITALDTLATIKENTAFEALVQNLSVELLPELRHMNRTQSLLQEEEIKTLALLKGAALSMVFTNNNL